MTDYYLRGRTLEAIAAYTKFKAYYWLDQVSETFVTIDFALNPKINNKAWEFVDDKVPQTVIADEVVSFKSTIHTNWEVYLNAVDGKMKKHLDDFNEGLGIGENKGFKGKQKTIQSNKGRLVIKVPEKNLSKVGSFPRQYGNIVIEVITDNALIN